MTCYTKLPSFIIHGTNVQGNGIRYAGRWCLGYVQNKVFDIVVVTCCFNLKPVFEHTEINAYVDLCTCFPLKSGVASEIKLQCRKTAVYTGTIRREGYKITNSCCITYFTIASTNSEIAKQVAQSSSIPKVFFCDLPCG